MLIGAHVSAAGGANKAVSRAEEIGAECFQIFASSPRMWSVKPIDDTVVEKYQAEITRAGMGPTVLHGKYLVALGSSDAELVGKSETALRSDVAAANKLGALGVIFHPASHRGQGFDAIIDQFACSVRKILDEENVEDEHRSNILGQTWAKGERQGVTDAKEFLKGKVADGIISEECSARIVKLIDSLTTRR